MRPEARARALALRPILVPAAAVVVLLLAFAGRYGYHRDELYFLACGRRLAWGFVDQPPITPALARLSDALFPGSLVGLRLWSALAIGALVVLSAVTARELGAGRVGQVGAAVLAACMLGLLLAGHLLSTETFDLLEWAVVTLFVVRIVRRAEPRLWPVVGVAVGLGLENKWSIAFLVVGLLIGLLVTPQRRVLWTPWFAGGVAIAFAIWLPNLMWQADHSWPQLEMIRAIRDDSMDAGATLAWFPLQVLITGPVVAIAWVAGLVRLFRDEDVRSCRFVAIAYVVLAAVFAVSAGDKPYYVAGMYVPLLGAGAAPLERWLARHRRGVAAPAVGLVLAATTLAFLPVALPVVSLPAFADSPINDVNPEMGEQVGWPALVTEVARVWDDIPAEERSTAILLTANYGEAGAIERFGPAFGLPEPYSGHNNYWWWGPPPGRVRTVVLVGWSPSYASRFFGSVERVATIRNAFGVENEEEGAPILVATDPLRPLPAVWPALRHYD
jgi:4-amino-4-deoxy-L-arabinose transferase-like glycosyltransferase